MEDDRLNRNANTFIITHEIWEEKPRLIHQQEIAWTSFKSHIDKVDHLKTIV